MQQKESSPHRSPWSWIPTLYFAEGIPYTVVMLISVVFYKRMGISNGDIALYTSWLYLPWVIKPFWSPLVEVFRTKRFWIVTMQLLIGVGLGGVVLAIPSPVFFKVTLGFLWLLAFSSATHDIAADGFYMLGLSDHDQALYVGIRSTFYRFAMIAGQGLLIMFAGLIESHTGLEDQHVEVYAIHAQSAVLERSKSASVDESGPLRLVVSPDQIELNLGSIEKERFQETFDAVTAWNRSRGDSSIPAPDIRQVPLSPTGKEGNVASFRVSLSRRPEDSRPVVVHLGQSTGDKGIHLLTETRIEFDQNTWNRPYVGLIQHDASMKQPGAAVFHVRSGNIRLAWSMAFLALALLFVFFFFYHSWVLPRPESGIKGASTGDSPTSREFAAVFISFFSKERIGLAILFILIYRLGEAQLVKVAPLFMLDSIEAGGLGISTTQYGFIYGTLGMLALTAGGILGGWVVSRSGLKYWIFWMALAMNVPDALYVLLSHWQPDSLGWIAACVCVEQLGYGFGFTAFLLYMITVSDGPHKTSHYAFCTGIMALGMMIPGMFSGILQEYLGYQKFFWWVLIACVPGILMIRYLKIDAEYGKQGSEED